MKKIPLTLFFICVYIFSFSQVPSYVPTSGLLAWYPLNGNANNAFGTGNNGVQYGTVTYGIDRFGYPNTCYVGNGNSGIDIPHNNFPTGNAPRSASVWFKCVLPYPGGYRELYANGSNSFIGSRFGMDVEPANTGFESTGFGKQHTITHDSCWHNLTVTYPPGGVGQDSVHVYFDGNLATTFYISSMTTLNTDSGNIHTIGALFLPPYNPYTPGAFLYSFVGSIDDVGVWNRELTASEVAALYYASVPITGPTFLCAGASLTLADTALGGSWSSGNPAVATVGSGTGIVTGISSGTAIISYTTGTICPVVSTIVVSVSVAPPISGSPNLCTGSVVTLSDAVAGGIWTSTNISIATIDSSSGIMTGVTSGSTTITYTLPGGCYTTATVTVNALPTPISGTLTLCVGATTSLSDGTPGGAWSSVNTSVATVDSVTGVVSGVTAGNDTISYSSGSCVVSTVVTVNPNPSAINGQSDFCLADSVVTFTDSVSSGTWSSSNTSVITINPSTGMVNGIGDGTSIITYSLPGNCYTTITVTVTLPPAPITGDLTICVGNSTPLTDATPDGIWSSSNILVATVTATSSNGFVTGILAGTSVISYAIGSCYTTATVTVTAPSPLTNVTVSQTIPFGSSIQLNADNALFYMWKPEDGSLSNPNINNPVATPQSPTTYYVVGIDENGCRAIDSVTIALLYDTLGIPSAFTPNGDGLNDFFRISNLGFYKLVNMSLYNRWGALVYNVTDGSNTGWDGNYNGTKQDIGVYNYMIIIEKPDGSHQTYKGNFTLIR